MGIRKYEINATYRVAKILEVTVPEGSDAMDPKNWLDIVNEHDSDSSLWEVESAEEIGTE